MKVITALEEKIFNEIFETEYKDLCPKFMDLANRPMTPYTRGIMHGFLLALTELGIVDSDTVMQYLLMRATVEEEV